MHLFAAEQPSAQSPGLGVTQAVGLRPPLGQTLVATPEPGGGVDGRLDSLSTKYMRTYIAIVRGYKGK